MFSCLICSKVSEMEETMLSVLRPSQKTAESVISSPTASTRLPLDPSELPPDKLHVELELSPDSQITLYGPLLKAFLSIKVGIGTQLIKCMDEHREESGISHLEQNIGVLQNI